VRPWREDRGASRRPEASCESVSLPRFGLSRSLTTPPRRAPLRLLRNPNSSLWITLMRLPHRQGKGGAPAGTAIATAPDEKELVR
jgi:hypothetical protein